MANFHSIRDLLADRLRQAVDGEVRFDGYSRALYRTDASIYQIDPIGVVVPRTLEAVQRTVQIAVEHGVPLLPRGGGTSLSGQAVGPALVIDFSKYLNRIIEIDAERRVARVQPGVVLDQLNQAAARFGLQFGPDVATSDRANLGGMIGNNSAGARSIRHGKTVDHVRQLDVVLADGTSAALAPLTPAKLAVAKLRPGLEGNIYRTVSRVIEENRGEIVARYPKILRRVSGYNLDEFVPECKEGICVPPSVAELRARHEAEWPGADFHLAKLVVGSEGTLVTVAEAELDLVPLPPHRGLVVLHFDTLTHAVEAVPKILEHQPSAVELLDRLILDLAARNLEYRRYLDFVVGSPEALLIVEFNGQRFDEVTGEVRRLQDRLRGMPGIEHTLLALEPEKRDHIWRCRKAALPLLLGIPGARQPVAFVEDTAVNPDRLPEFVSRFRQIIEKHDTQGAYYGHASVGCLHIRPLLNLKDPSDVAKLRPISEAVCDLVMEFGGAMSGEHGDGLSRSHWNRKLFGERLYEAFRQVKRAFDPRGLMNPGKIVDSPAPDQNLRWPQPYKPIALRTYFDFTTEGGMAAAAERCNGSGVCRKLDSGTMCPSFMVTREEEHTTRGRANALRLVMTGQLPPSELTSHRLYEVLDLCLMCKACKAECPSNVDLAKLKAELLAHYYDEHPMPIGARAMAHVALLNRIGSATAPLSNGLPRLPGASWLVEKLLGIDRRRRLPRFHRRHFRKWFHRHRKRQVGVALRTLLPSRPPGGRLRSGSDSAMVILLDDCLTSYCEPQVNQAAVRVLEAAGYQVELASLWCCGRPMISKGLLREAQELARSNIERLIGWAEAGVPIVGCEPSCLLTLVDEYPDLVPGEASRRIAESAFLIDHWLADRVQNGGVLLPLRPLAEKALLHGHCQQKAMVGTEGTRRFLELIPQVRAQELDAGCCGMAGSFGYEKGHYEISMAIGQRVLFPAVEDHAGPIVAPGFSCRHQVEHFTGKRPMHPVELLYLQMNTETVRNSHR